MAFDLDAVIAERDAKEPFAFTFDGAEYTMPNDVDVRVIDLLMEGELAGALELLLGDEQWSAIVASPKTLGTAALGDLVTAYFTHVGVDMGESSASTRSFKSTARPSKLTSPTTIRGPVTNSENSDVASPGDDSESS